MMPHASKSKDNRRLETQGGDDATHLDLTGAADNGGAPTESEISALITGALHDALQAAGQSCPDTYIDILQGRKRQRMAQSLANLPAVQRCHPAVEAEILAEVALAEAQAKLAKAIVESVRHLAVLKRRAIVAAIH